MTEHEAQEWIAHLDGVSRETFDNLQVFAEMVIAANEAQNLIGAATVPQIWSRHMADSAQLVPLAGDFASWLDLGSGPGFPGMVSAIMSKRPTALVESRRKRIAFLESVKERLRLDNVHVAGCRIESFERKKFAVISARAFAPLPRLLELAHSFSTEKTLWLLPKGRSAREELAMAQATWQGEFHVKPSLTDPEASIIVATNVRPKRRSR